MKAYLTRRAWFSASHRLHNPRKSESENQQTYGKCNNPHGHGHNYFVEVTVGGKVNPATGMVCNLQDLDDFISREILEPFALSNLNYVESLLGVIPTTENLCLELYRRFELGFSPAKIEGIRVEETMLNSFEYYGNRERELL